LISTRENRSNVENIKFKILFTGVMRLGLSEYQTPTLLEVAYKSLKSDIMKNKFIQGQKIVSRELVERYGISETPIKQALNRLVSEGLVESIPRKGMRVRRVKQEDIENLFEIRYMVETFFIKNIIGHIKKNPLVLGGFYSIIQRQENITQNILDIEDYDQFYILDSEFHRLYIQCAGNKKIVQIYDNLGIYTCMYFVYGKDHIHQLNGMKEHKLIYEALKSQNEDELKKCIELHIKNSKKEIFKALEK
jgi:DNA-binding GntR family transcriptional regulator